MTLLTDENQLCPVCGQEQANTDFETRTNESELHCQNCGFLASKEIHKDADGRQFWVETTWFPITADGTVLRGSLGNQKNPQVVARITELIQSLGLDFPVAEEVKAARFAILRSPAAAVSDPICIILPILQYLNADPDGHYRKNDDDSVPPIHWELRYLGVSQYEMKQIQKLPDTGQTVDDIDLIMLRSDPAFGREFSRASHSARWKKNPELVTEVEKAAADASAALAAKVAGRTGVTMVDDFRVAAAAIEMKSKTIDDLPKHECSKPGGAWLGFAEMDSPTMKSLADRDASQEEFSDQMTAWIAADLAKNPHPTEPADQRFQAALYRNIPFAVYCGLCRQLLCLIHPEQVEENEIANATVHDVTPTEKEEAPEDRMTEVGWAVIEEAINDLGLVPPSAPGKADE